MAMDRTLLLAIIREQHEATRAQPSIPRSMMGVLNHYRNTPEIIVISGIRRCGKSTFLGQIRAQYEQSDYYLNFDDDRLMHFQVSDFQLLLELFSEEFGDQTTFFFDEIQNINGWERFIRRLHDQGKKAYITGSNATMLSRELGTHLTGRYIPIELYPLSFYEIVSHEAPHLLSSITALTTTKKGEMMRLFREYMTHGGFPGFRAFRQPDYLKTLFDSILYRDIVSRYHLRDETALKETASYAASQIGKELSFSKLRQLLGLSSPHTVKNYFDYLESVYLCFLIKKYDPSLKKQLLNAKVPYFVDSALCRIVGFRPTEDEGRFLENTVFLELKRRNHDIFFHKGKKGCDFLIREGLHILQAIQVTKTMKNPDTRKRELDGLVEALETYPNATGLIVTEDEEFTEILTLSDQTTRVIHGIPIWKWLLTL